ncbi:MAG: ketopantoate reductase family protein [Myxococcales bacterium]|nr:ketopantoate reductase family protein [Polyangiaceae bacterium]MDW8251884.1 ketopantoate reductase family protein [Myxococcales bacterium]
MSETVPPSVVVVGAGGIGGITAASLTELGVPVTCVTGREDIARALREQGARVREAEGERLVQGIRAFAALPSGEGPFSFALLAVQPPQVEEAAQKITPFLANNGRMVCLANGLCEQRIAPLVGEHRVLGAIVGWGASQLAPGHYERTAAGGFTLGYLDGRIDAQVECLSRLLECIGPVEISTNLLGARWSKLAINCAISTLGTLGGERLGVLVRYRIVRRLALELMTEAVAVARAEGVKLQKVIGTLDLDWMALTETERSAAGSVGLVAKHGMLLAVGARFRRMRSSMLAAIERGRPPAVDYLNGEVVERGRRHGIATPVNAAAQDMVHEIAQGRRTSSLSTIRELYIATRTVRGRQEQEDEEDEG